MVRRPFRSPSLRFAFVCRGIPPPLYCNPPYGENARHFRRAKPFRPHGKIPLPCGRVFSAFHCSLCSRPWKVAGKQRLSRCHVSGAQAAGNDLYRGLRPPAALFVSGGTPQGGFSCRFAAIHLLYAASEGPPQRVSSSAVSRRKNYINCAARLSLHGILAVRAAPLPARPPTGGWLGPRAPRPKFRFCACAECNPRKMWRSHFFDKLKPSPTVIGAGLHNAFGAGHKRFKSRKAGPRFSRPLRARARPGPPCAF